MGRKPCFEVDPTPPVPAPTRPATSGDRELDLAEANRRLHREVEKRKRLHEELRREQEHLRRMLEVYDHDRRLIAYEIHDGLTQHLAGARMYLGTATALVGNASAEARRLFERGMELLDDGMREARRLIDDLRPLSLDENGLVEALEELVCKHQASSGPVVQFLCRAEVDHLPPPLQNAVYRIVQEGLTNACRYSGSELVRVELKSERPGRLLVVVQDWGRGFDPAAVRKNAFGLEGIRERARLLGGRASVSTVPGKGTRIGVELPTVLRSPCAAV